MGFNSGFKGLMYYYRNIFLREHFNIILQNWPLFVRSVDVNSMSLTFFTSAPDILSMTASSQLTACVIIRLSFLRDYGQRVVIKETE